ncbi:hypothetical protein TSMEX_005736 [Taenia solium]|eukprot:TsM_000790400 transcript=TsM_000790400 gene=TsM_000790400
MQSTLNTRTHSYDMHAFKRPHFYEGARLLQLYGEREGYQRRKLYGRKALDPHQKVNLRRCLSLGSKGRTWLLPKLSPCEPTHAQTRTVLSRRPNYQMAMDKHAI